MRGPLLLITVFASTIALAQEANYWTSQVGSTASLLGGAITGSVRDNSAIYYNPAALGYIENPSLSMVGNAYFANATDITNGAGENISLSSRRVDNIPQLLSGVFKKKDNPYFTFSWAIFNTQKYTFDYRVRNDIQYDVIESRPGEEYYSGSWSYYNSTKKDWFGLGLGQRVGKNKDISIGISLLVNIRNQDYGKAFSANVLDEQDSTNNSLGSVTSTEAFDYRDFGFVPILGISKAGDHFSHGFTLTFPKIDIGFIGNGSLDRVYTQYLPSVSPINPVFSYSQSEVKTFYRSPWIFDYGLEYKWADTNLITFRVAYFTQIEPYEILETETSSNPVTLAFQGSAEGFNNMYMANKPIANFGVGFAHKLVEGFGILSGFHTDFNYLDVDALLGDNLFVPAISTWNMYHTSLGVIWYQEKFDLEAGFRYSFGVQDSYRQQVNLSDPKDYLRLQGMRDNSASVFASQFAFVFGFTYKFPRI